MEIATNFTHEEEGEILERPALFTTILPGLPGYTWQWIPPMGQYVLKWKPVPTFYSPPCLDQSVIMRTLAVPPEVLGGMGLVIGREGCFFKQLTGQSGCLYLFYRSEFANIEIWGKPEAVAHAMILLTHHMQSIRQQYFPTVPAYCL